jgi:hypothetical protein
MTDFLATQILVKKDSYVIDFTKVLKLFSRRILFLSEINLNNH